jgi:ribulose 1,5-bisphosphate synthetase/thiazole synthase
MFAMALCKAFLALSSLPTILAVLDASFSNLSEVIEKDVVIVGGGASGSHAAVRLREDYNKSVILIEKEAILVSKLLWLSQQSIGGYVLTHLLKGWPCRYILRPSGRSIS